VELEGLRFEVNLGKKLVRLSKIKVGMVDVPIIPATQKVVVGELLINVAWGKSIRPRNWKCASSCRTPA
jgi:hypothetical protein